MIISSAIMFKFEQHIYMCVCVCVCELFTCWRLYKLQRFDTMSTQSDSKELHK